MQRSYKTSKGTELPLLNLRGKEYLEVKYRLVWFREDHPNWAIETDLLSVTETSAYGRAAVKDEHGRIIATSHKFEAKNGFPDFIEKAETGAIGRALALIGYGTQFCADELDARDGVTLSVAPSRSTETRSPSAPPRGDHPSVKGPVVKPVGESSPRDARAGELNAVASQTRTAVTPQASAQAVASALNQPARETKRTEPNPAANSDGRVAAIPTQVNLHSNTGSNPGPHVRPSTPLALVDQAHAKSALGSAPGDYKITFGKKFKGTMLKEVSRKDLEGYLQWLEGNAEKTGLPLSEEARELKDAVAKYLQA